MSKGRKKALPHKLTQLLASSFLSFFFSPRCFPYSPKLSTCVLLACVVLVLLGSVRSTPKIQTSVYFYFLSFLFLEQEKENRVLPMRLILAR
jgi:hypothetical protein